MIDKTIATEYAALARLSKANRRANLILMVLFSVILVSAIIGGVSLYRSEQRAFKQQAMETNQLRDDIRSMTDHSITINKETIHYNTCILVYEIIERTPAQQRECFKQADLPGGLSEEDFVTVPPDRAGPVAGSASLNRNRSSGTSSSNNAPNGQVAQPNNSQSSNVGNGNTGGNQEEEDSDDPPPFMIGPVPVCVPFTDNCLR